MLSMMTPQIGDKIRMHGLMGVSHYGIYVGPRGPNGEDVVHNDKHNGVELVTFKKFSRGKEVTVVARVAESLDEQREIMARALSMLGRRYELLSFNCEHAANYALSGTAMSEKVNGALAVGVMGGLLAIALIDVGLRWPW